MKRWRVILVVWMLIGGVAHAQHGKNRPRGGEPKKVIPPSRAVSIAKERNEGQVLSTELVQSGGKQQYRIKMIENGKVRTVTVDAAPGD